MGDEGPINRRLAAILAADIAGYSRLIGLNLGDVIHDDTRIYGDGINIAARLEALAEPGGMLVSSTVYDRIVEGARKAGLPEG